MSDKQLYLCDCDKVIELQRGFLNTWKPTRCPACYTAVPDDSKTKSFFCQHCNQRIRYNSKKPDLCPKCRKPLENTASLTLLSITCTECGQYMSFAPGTTSQQCLRCGVQLNPQRLYDLAQTASLSATMPIICNPTEPEWVIHRVDKSDCPINTPIKFQTGADAYVVIGDLIYPVPGDSYRLQDIPGLPIRSGATTISCSVCYVRKQLNVLTYWGCSKDVSVTEGYTQYGVIHAGHAPLDIDNTERFLRWMKCTPCTRATLTFPRDAPDMSVIPEKALEIQALLNLHHQTILETTRARYPHYPFLDLSGHADDLLNTLKDVCNQALKEYGLKLLAPALEYGPKVTVLRSFEHIECDVVWTTDEISVHDAQRAALRAELTLTGAGHICVADAQKLMNSSEWLRFQQQNAEVTLPRQELSRRIGEQAHHHFQLLLPTMIADTNMPLNELAVFFPECAGQLASILNHPNGPMGRIGLRVEDLTIKQRDFKPSPALAQTLHNMQETTTLTLRYDLRKYTRKLESDEQIDSIYTARRIAEAEEDTAYQAWLAKDRFDTAKAEADIRNATRTQQTKHQQQMDQLKHEQSMAEIMFQMEQSKLDWRQKLDAYARLQKINEAHDNVDLEAYKTRTGMETENLAAQMQLRLSREANDMLEVAESRKEAREERIQKAEFARDMTIRQMELYHELEGVKLQNEQQLRIQQLEQEARKNAADLEMARLTLTHLEKLQRDRSEQARYQAQMQQARANAERDCTRRFEGQERARQDREAAERRRLDMQEANRAERLIERMLETQKALETLRRKNEKEYNAGLAQARQAGSEPVQRPQLEQLTQAVRALIDSLRGQSASQPAAPSAAPASPVSHPHTSVLGTQPGMQKAPTCPYCGKLVSHYDSVCPHCQKLI